MIFFVLLTLSIWSVVIYFVYNKYMRPPVYLIQKPQIPAQEPAQVQAQAQAPIEPVPAPAPLQDPIIPQPKILVEPVPAVVEPVPIVSQLFLKDNRCIEPMVTLNQQEIDNLERYITYINPTQDTLNSCYPTYNSIYSVVTGRFIRLYSLDNSSFILNHISVSDKYGNVISANHSNCNIGIPCSIIYCNEPANELTIPQPAVPFTTAIESILNSSSVIGGGGGGSDSNTDPGGLTVTNRNTTPDFYTNNGAYIQIDLGSNAEIGYVTVGNNFASSSSIVNKWIMVCHDDGNSYDAVNPFTIVCNYQILFNNDKIYTQSKVVSNSYVLTDLFENFSADVTPCQNCLTSDQTLIKNYRYIKNIDGVVYCYAANEYNINSSDLGTFLYKFKPCPPGLGEFPPVVVNLLWTVDASDITTFDFIDPIVAMTKDVSPNIITAVKMKDINNNVIATFEPYNNADPADGRTPYSVNKYYDSKTRMLINNEGYVATPSLIANTIIPLRNVTLFVVGKHVASSRSEFISISRSDGDGYIEPTTHFDRYTFRFTAYLRVGHGNAAEYNSATTSEYDYMLDNTIMHYYVFIITDGYQQIIIDGITKSISYLPIQANDSTSNQWSWLTTNFNLAEMRAYAGRYPLFFVESVTADLKNKWS